MRLYYWLLWWLGFRDDDGNIRTPDDREKITFILRRSMNRLGTTWWILVLLTLYSLVVMTSYLGFQLSPWSFLTGAFLLFFSWLFVHVAYTRQTPT